MKISIDNVEIFELNELQQKVMKHFIHADEFEADIKRRLEWIVMHKYEECFREMKQEWDVKLEENGIDMIPTNKDSYAEIVFQQPNYMDRKQRELASLQNKI